MKALATFALLGLAYTSNDNEFLVRPVHVPKKPHHEHHEHTPEMSKPLPPPMGTHNNQFVVRPIYIPKKPHNEKHDQEKIPHMLNPLPPVLDHEIDFSHSNNELFGFANGMAHHRPKPIENFHPVPGLFDDTEDDEFTVVRPAIYYPPKPSNKPIYCEDDEFISIGLTLPDPPKQNPRPIYYDDDEFISIGLTINNPPQKGTSYHRPDDYSQLVEALNEALRVERLKKEALIAAQELKKTHADLEFMKVLKEVVEEDDHDDNLANLGEIIRHGVKMHNDAMNTASKQIKDEGGFLYRTKRHV